MFRRIHFRRPHIQNKHIGKIRAEPRGNQAAADIFNRHADKVDRILGAGVGRCVAEFCVAQIFSCAVEPHNRCDNVNPLVRPLAADGLRPENFAAVIIQHLQHQVFGIGIISGVAGGIDNHFVKGYLRPRELPLVVAGKSRGQPENLNGAAALCRRVGIRRAGDMVGNQPPLPVGRSRQRNGAAFA